MKIPALAVAGLFAALLLSPARADEPYYKGKRINLVINFAAGGPTDIEGRIFTRHLARHIAGQPSLIVQNMDGAGGMIGANYIGEVAPRDGTAIGYFTGAAWREIMTPEKFRTPFKTFEFLAYQPGVSIAFARADIPPGLKVPADIAKAQGVVAGGLGPENSKDLMIRLGLDMLGIKYGYVTSYRGSPAARLALQQGEVNFYSESPPSYRAQVVPTLVQTGVAIPIWYDPIYDGDTFSSSRQIEGLAIPSFPELYQQIKGTMPSGRLWDIYRTVLIVHGAMQRLIALPPGTPPAAVEALRTAVAALNEDKAYQDEAVKTIGYVPEWVSGPQTNDRVRKGLAAPPDMRGLLNDYIQQRAK